ncbi:hypothetical protein Bca4012_063940 [Brassica carinata]
MSSVLMFGHGFLQGSITRMCVSTTGVSFFLGFDYHPCVVWPLKQQSIIYGSN